MTVETSLRRYDAVADRAAEAVIGAYSTSFGAATRLLGRRHRQHVRNIYALVRVADELVDGVCTEAGLDVSSQRRCLDEYEHETYRAIESGYSSNLIIHAFARTVRACGIEREIIQPFFDSMRADVDSDGQARHMFGPAEHADYVYGSAQVVGLMCLRVFTRGRLYTPDELETLERGAKQLGAAFQNVNFLRDLADDTGRLGRSYLSDSHTLTDRDRDEWVARIDEELRDAEQTLPLLPKDARRAVRSALSLFRALNDRITATPTSELYRRRVRVPDPHKFALIAGAVTRTMVESK